MKENIFDVLCLSCMRDAGEKFETCPFCGAPANIENQFHQLAPRSVLNGRFVVGRTLGQGGFGITYAGYDLTVGEKVAIKEFYPDGGVSRQKDLYTILPYSEEKTQTLFTEGKAKFLKEAQKLERFTDVDGIVQVKDFFEENGTAYIVMEYVEGPTLIRYLNTLGQPILPSDLYILLTPIFGALEQVHAQGILHRDISPDNIIVSPTEAKLLDFGAARDFSLLGEKSNTINIKAGYAPEEQYLTHGKQGPWTDVYALAATCYRAVTGKTPASSIERLSSDELIPPSALSGNVTPGIEQVLLKGMAIRKENRYQSVREFREALSRAIEEAHAETPDPFPKTVPLSDDPAQPQTAQGSTAQPQTAQDSAAHAEAPDPFPKTVPLSVDPTQPQTGQGTEQPVSRQLNYSSSWKNDGSARSRQADEHETPPPREPPAPARSRKPLVGLILGILSLVLVLFPGSAFLFRGDNVTVGLLIGAALAVAAIAIGLSARRVGNREKKGFAGILAGIVSVSVTLWLFLFEWFLGI